MPIFRHVLEPNDITFEVLDYPGHEAGMYLHGPGCPLCGQQTARYTGACTASCGGPSKPVHLAMLHMGAVVDQSGTAGIHIRELREIDGFRFCPEPFAVIWDGAMPVSVPVYLGIDIPDTVQVDADKPTMDLYVDWILEQAIQLDDATRLAGLRKKQAAVDEARFRASALEKRKHEEAIQSRIWNEQKYNMLKPGVRVRIVSDAPGFAERNAKLKPRNRTQSLIQKCGWVSWIGTGGDSRISVRFGQPSDKTPFETVFVDRSQVRIFHPDGEHVCLMAP